MYSVEALQKIITIEIENRSDELKSLNPVDLYRPVEYALNIGGKRLRPVLLLLSYNLFSDDIKAALPTAVAIEKFMISLANGAPNRTTGPGSENCSGSAPPPTSNPAITLTSPATTTRAIATRWRLGVC